MIEISDEQAERIKNAAAGYTEAHQNRRQALQDAQRADVAHSKLQESLGRELFKPMARSLREFAGLGGIDRFSVGVSVERLPSVEQGRPDAYGLTIEAPGLTELWLLTPTAGWVCRHGSAAMIARFGDVVPVATIAAKASLGEHLEALEPQLGEFVLRALAIGTERGALSAGPSAMFKTGPDPNVLKPASPTSEARPA